MFDIAHNGIIRVNRGDSFRTPLFINVGTSLNPIRYVLKDNDILYFGLMEPNQPFELAIVKRRFTAEDLNNEGDAVLHFRPQDTECLLPGKYFYQVKLQSFNSDDLSDYEVDTVIDRTEFWVLE